MELVATTQRLNIQQFVLDDAAYIYQLLNSSGWKQFIGDRKIVSLEAAQTYIQKSLLNCYKAQGFGFWKLSLKDTGDFVGMCGLVKRDYLEFADIGYALLPEYFGMGYAKESCDAVIAIAKEKYSLHPLMAITDETNQSSINLLSKLGFRYYKETENPEGQMLKCYLMQE